MSSKASERTTRRGPAERRFDGETLRKNEAASGLQAVIDAIPGFVVVLAPDGSVETPNSRFVEYCGLKLDEIRNWATNGMLHDDELAHVIETFTTAIAAGTPFAIEQWLRRSDGVFRWFRNRAEPVRDASGRIAQWYVLLDDIDERKRAEEALAESERNLKLTIDTTPALIWSAGPDGTTVSVNQHFVDYLGDPWEEMKERGWVDAVHPDDLAALSTVWNDLRERRVAGQAEARLRRHDGAYRWFLMRVNPLRDQEGNLVKWYGVNVDIEDRKSAEEAIAASERHLKETINAIPTFVFCNRADGPNEFMNLRWHDYTGITPEKAAGRGWTASLHPDDLPHLMEEWLKMLHEKRGGEVEGRMRRFDGVYRRFLFQTDALRDDAGNVLKWYGTITDIEDRKQAETKLHRALSHLTEAQRMSKTGSFTADLASDERDWSDELYRIFGFEPGSRITAQTIVEAVVPEDRIPYEAAFRRALEGAEIDFEFRVAMPDGSLKHLRAVAHRNEQIVDRPVFFGAIQDVTEGKVAAEALLRSEAFLSQGEAVSETGSFLWRLETDEIRWSKQLYRIFEFELETPITLARIAARVHPDDSGMMEDMVRRARTGRDSQYNHRLLMSDGSIKYMHFVAQAVRDQAGRPEYIGVVQDITARRLSEQALSKVSSELAHVSRAAALGALTASIAHEVNQPLSGIITNAATSLRMLATDPPNIEGAIETARRTIRDGNRASEVIKRLRGLFGRKEFAAESVDLNEATREVIALSLHELQRQRVSVRTEFEDETLLVTGDRVQLQQVILNLLLNAADAMKHIDDRPRQVLIRTARDGADRARLSVRDTGTGIASDAAGKLFDAFYTTKPDGMGIGLSVSRTIIEHHQGRLWASQNDGPGATFSFAIPAGKAG